MIDLKTLECLSPDALPPVVAAINLVAQSGLIQAQREVNLQSIIHGDPHEDPAVLAERIIKFRQSQYALDQFEAFANNLKEQTNA